MSLVGGGLLAIVWQHYVEERGGDIGPIKGLSWTNLLKCTSRLYVCWLFIKFSLMWQCSMTNNQLSICSERIANIRKIPNTCSNLNNLSMRTFVIHMTSGYTATWPNKLMVKYAFLFALSFNFEVLWGHKYLLRLGGVGAVMAHFGWGGLVKGGVMFGTSM